MKNKIISLQLLVFGTLLCLINICTSENVKKSIDDPGDGDEDAEEESLEIAVENETVNLTCTRRVNSQMHEIRAAGIHQFPFVAAIMSDQNEYLCAGSVVSNGLILTTATCTLQPVSYALLNTTRDKKDSGSVMLHTIKSEKFPTFTGSDSLKDVGLIYTEKHNSTIASKIRLSNYTSARNLIDIEAIGFGLNAEVGEPKELQYIGLELRSLLESVDILKAYFDCIETKVPTCFKDSGGPVIFDNELIGIVTKGQEDCTKEMSAVYAINKKVADILPTYTFKAWLDERIKKNDELPEPPLKMFPEVPPKPILRTLPEKKPLPKPKPTRKPKPTPNVTESTPPTHRQVSAQEVEEAQDVSGSGSSINTPLPLLLLYPIIMAITFL